MTETEMATIAQDNRATDRFFEYQPETISSGVATITVSLFPQPAKLEPSCEVSAEVRTALAAAEQHVDSLQQRQMPTEPVTPRYLLTKDTFEFPSDCPFATSRIFAFARANSRMIRRHKRRARFPDLRLGRETRLTGRFNLSPEILGPADSEWDKLEIVPAVSPSLAKSRQGQSVIVSESARCENGQI